jgi:hypothetical protein
LAAFFAAGRLRAGALFFAPDFFDAFFRAAMDESSFNERETRADKMMTHGVRPGKGL